MAGRQSSSWIYEGGCGYVGEHRDEDGDEVHVDVGFDKSVE